MKLKRLIRQCKEQDLKAQEELYHLYSGKFFSLCLKYSGNYEEAQDLLQDGFLKIFTGIKKFSGKGSFEGWMTRIFINTALNKIKEQKHFLRLAEDYCDETELPAEADFLKTEFFIEIIQELPPVYRAVFNLYVMDGYSHKEIAQFLEISEGTSKSNLARARQKLRERIIKHLNSPSAKTL